MSVLRLKDRITGQFVPVVAIKGETGDAAGFGTVEASVDANYGTPSVEVTASGEDTAKNFSFAFHNLKQAPYNDSDLRNQIATERARIDSFTHLAEGSTTGDAELIDGRTVDGVTHTNIGDAIRAVNTNLKSDINDFSAVVHSVNVYDSTSSERVENSYLNWRGQETSNNGAVISPYISVTEGDVLRWIYNPNTSNNYGSFYDSAKAFKAQIASSSPAKTNNYAIDGYLKSVITVAVPSGVAYARVNLLMSNDNEYNMVTVNNDMPHTFIPYSVERMVDASKLINKESINNPLYMKTAVFNGDSICAGTVGISSSDEKYAWGWAGRIGTNNSMTWHNFGVAGGTVCTDTYNYTKVGTTGIDWTRDCYIRIGSSASGTDTMYALVTQETWDGTSAIYYRGDARHWESTDIDNMHTAYPNADYVILEACLNDGFNGVPKGSVATTYGTDFLTTTYASAFEHMLKDTINLFPKAKIGVIIPHRPDGNNAYISQLNDLAKQACQKWAIPYIDLYHESGLCVNLSAQKSVMFYDDTHLSQTGYDFITPKIESWMKSL